MKKSLLRQKGVTFFGMLAVVLVIIFGVLLVIKVMPPYMQNFAIKEALNDIAKEPDIAQMSKGKVKDKLERRLQVEGINVAIADNLLVEKKDGKMHMLLKYENRVPIIGNVDFVFKFDEQVKIE